MAGMMAGGSTGTRIAAAALAAVLLAAVVLVFVVLYVAITPKSSALDAMGIVALILALVSYLAQSFSRDPVVQRSVAWGLGAMGFAILFLTIWFVAPTPSSTGQLIDTLVLVLVLAVTIGLAYWRVGSVGQTRAREQRRAAWDQSTPPSAFDYAAAKTPGTGSVGAPSTPPPGPRSP